MEHLYIVAETESGPCKIGRSRPDLRRLSALQSGNPGQLEEFATFPLRSNSVLAEQLAHWVLEDYRIRERREWFAVTVKQAAYVLNDVVRNVRATVKDDVILQRHFLKFCGISNAESQEYWDWHDENDGGSCPEFNLPDLFLIKALIEVPSRRHMFTFAEWMATLPEGYPYSNTEYSLVAPRPNFKNLKSLLPVIRFLEKNPPSRPLYYETAWLSWCNGRDTDDGENKILVWFWNKFVSRWNQINRNGFASPQNGIDNTVNGVRFLCMSANQRLGHGAYLCFYNEHFNVIIAIGKNKAPVDQDCCTWEKLIEIEPSNLKGFIVPRLSNISDNPFDTYASIQIDKMNKSFSQFIFSDFNDFLEAESGVRPYPTSPEAHVVMKIA